MIIPSAFAANCEKYVIKDDLSDFVYYYTEILQPPKYDEIACKAYYDTYDLAQEFIVFIIELENEQTAINHIRNKYQLYTRFEGPDGFEYITKTYNNGEDETIEWISGKYLIWVSGPVNLKSNECKYNEPSWCILEEYTDKIGSTMDKIFAEDSPVLKPAPDCYNFEIKEYDNSEVVVCEEISKGEIYEPPAEYPPQYYCTKDEDCPGDGYEILTSKGYQLYVCNTDNRCYITSVRSIDCITDSDCEGVCDTSTLDRNCVDCLENKHCLDDEYCSNKKCIALSCNKDEKSDNHKCVKVAKPEPAVEQEPHEQVSEPAPKTNSNMIAIIAALAIIVAVIIAVFILRKRR